jgi:hypothetical protein
MSHRSRLRQGISAARRGSGGVVTLTADLIVKALSATTLTRCEGSSAVVKSTISHSNFPTSVRQIALNQFTGNLWTIQVGSGIRNLREFNGISSTILRTISYIPAITNIDARGFESYGVNGILVQDTGGGQVVHECTWADTTLTPVRTFGGGYLASDGVARNPSTGKVARYSRATNEIVEYGPSPTYSVLNAVVRTPVLYDLAIHPVTGNLFGLNSSDQAFGVVYEFDGITGALLNTITFASHLSGITFSLPYAA